MIEWAVLLGAKWMDELLSSDRINGVIRTNSGNSGDDLSELELVENGGLTGSVKSDHENAC